MELIKLLNEALLLSAIIFILFWVFKYLYKKLTPIEQSFFYFKSAEFVDGNWIIKIESPFDDFGVEINVVESDKNVAQKKASLSAGLNKVIIKTEDEYSDDKQYKIIIIASDQKVERNI